MKALAPIGSALTGILIGIGACYICSYFCLEKELKPIPGKYPYKGYSVPVVPGEHSLLVDPKRFENYREASV